MTYEFISRVINADIKDILPILQDNLKDKPEPDGFGAWLFISKENNTIVGDGGFKGIPDENGTIDLGYAMIEAQRQRGFGLLFSGMEESEFGGQTRVYEIDSEG